MKFSQLAPTVILLSLTSYMLFKTIAVSSARPISQSNDVEFFKGTWECKLKSSPTTFNWSVASGLKNSWLVGFVQKGQDKVTNDYWRINKSKIERFVFTGDGLLVRAESNGWQANKLIFLGSFSKPGEEFKARQTITKKGDREFLAMWEKMDRDQRWSTFSEERCIKQ
jgi:hypothetical protein